MPVFGYRDANTSATVTASILVTNIRLTAGQVSIQLGKKAGLHMCIENSSKPLSHRSAATRKQQAGCGQSQRQRLFHVLLAAGLALLAVPAVQAEQFDPPDMEGFMLHSERDADGDGDGSNETRITQYLNEKGDSLVSMSSKGMVWAWSLNTNNNDSAVRNYVIRDSNCDGIFDEVYNLDEDFHVPECVK